MAPTAEIATTPSGIHIAYYDKSHRYKIGEDSKSLAFVPSVSTILDKTLAKNLSGWAERGAVDGMLTLHRMGKLRELDATRALALLHDHGLRYYQTRDKAAQRGTDVHAVMEKLAEGVVPKVGDYPQAQWGYVQALCNWWIKANPEVIHSELMVASLMYGYAGRMDLLAKVNGKLGVIDLKTSRGVRESHHYQTAGYRLAVEESGYGTPEFGAILRVGEDGAYEYVESWAEDWQFIDLVKSHTAQKTFERATPEQYKVKRKKAA